MSYMVFAYLIDLDRLRAVYGSQEKALVDEITVALADYIADYDEQAADYEDDLADEETAEDERDAGAGSRQSLAEALSEIVAGTIQSPERGWQYGYALELLCMHLGQSLPHEPFEALHSSGIGKVTQLAGLEALNGRSRLPLPLPVPTDFPSITYLTWEEAQQTLAQVRPPDVVPDSAASEEDQTWAAEVREQYRAWLQAAVQAQQGIVAFLY